MQLLSISHSHIEMLKELPLRTTAIFAVLRGACLCIADAVNYSLVNLDSATLTPLLPISQDPPDSPPSEMHDLTQSSGTPVARPKSHQRPAILPVEDDEFLIASHTGSSTLGLFIKENGEPTRGTLEWASNVKSIGGWLYHRRFQNLADMVAPFLSCRLSVYRSPTAKQYYRGALSTHSRECSSDAGLLYHYNRPSVAIPNIRRIVTIAGNKGRTNTASLACQYHSWVS